jgi:hypothetical protein
MNQLSHEEVINVTAQFAVGAGVRDASRKLGYNKRTIANYYHRIVEVLEERQEESGICKLSIGEAWTKFSEEHGLRFAPQYADSYIGAWLFANREHFTVTPETRAEIKRRYLARREENSLKEKNAKRRPSNGKPNNYGWACGKCFYGDSLLDNYFASHPLWAWRREHQVSRRRLAELLGCWDATITSWETRRIPEHRFEQLQTVTGVDFRSLQEEWVLRGPQHNRIVWAVNRDSAQASVMEDELNALTVKSAKGWEDHVAEEKKNRALKRLKTFASKMLVEDALKGAVGTERAEAEAFIKEHADLYVDVNLNQGHQYDKSQSMGRSESDPNALDEIPPQSRHLVEVVRECRCDDPRPRRLGRTKATYCGRCGKPFGGFLMTRSSLFAEQVSLPEIKAIDVAEDGREKHAAAMAWKLRKKLDHIKRGRKHDGGGGPRRKRRRRAQR